MDYADKILKVNTDTHRLEMEVEGHIAFIDYKLTDERLFLIHTEVPRELEGRGVARAIVEKAFQFAKDKGYKVVPICPYIQSYLKKHREWDDIIASDAQDSFIDTTMLPIDNC